MGNYGIANWFYDNGNPGAWGGTEGSTGYHTLGYGFQGGMYYGKCAAGTNVNGGFYPGETNSTAGGRHAVCSCCATAPPCPAAQGSTIAGPHEQYGYCWYLSGPGVECDQACADLGGNNLAVQAESSWPDECGATSNYGIANWFYDNGNPGAWAGPESSSGYHTLGYGLPGSVYFGKCAAGTNVNGGFYPGETNGTAGSRNAVCVCFTSP